MRRFWRFGRIGLYYGRIMDLTREGKPYVFQVVSRDAVFLVLMARFSICLF